MESNPQPAHLRSGLLQIVLPKDETVLPEKAQLHSDYMLT